MSHSIQNRRCGFLCLLGLFGGASLLLLTGVARAGNEVWMYDNYNCRFTRFNFSGANLGFFNAPCYGIKSAVVGNEVWIYDNYNCRFTRFNFTGVNLGYYNAPCYGQDIEVVGNEVWLSDNYNCRITRFNSGGTNLGFFNTACYGKTLAAVGGVVWLYDDYNCRFNRYNTSGGSLGFYNAPCYGITSAVVGSEVWLYDNYNCRFNRFNTSGGSLGYYNAPCYGQDMAVVGSEVWLYDNYNCRINRFNFSGGNLGFHNSPCYGTALAVIFQPDCNSNGISDYDDIAGPTSEDCNTNLKPDECEIAVGSPAPGGPFFCTSGCNADCNSDGIPDICETDCNNNDVPDDCDIAGVTSEDCNANDVPDSCDIAGPLSEDCNANAVPDECDIAGGNSEDCNSNSAPDECEGGSGDLTWSGPDGEDFTTAAFWSPPIYPGSAATGVGNAVLSNGGSNDNRSVLRSEVHICRAMIEASGSGRQVLQIEAGAALETNDGVQIAPGGEVILRGGEVRGGLVSNAANTVSGYGLITANVLNEGLVRGDTGRLLELNGALFDNQATGTLTAPGSAVVRVGSLDVNQSGQIEAWTLAGVYFDAPLINAETSGITLLGGAVGADGLTNTADATIYGFGMLAGDVVNNGEIVSIADTEIIGDLDNAGTITVQSGVLTITGNLSNSGTIIGGFGGRGGDPCGGLVINGSYILGEGATLRLGCGTLKLGGNFDVAINDYERFDMTIATLQMAGLSGTQLLETLADDAGTCPTLPEPTLFSIGTLRIGPTPTTVKLVDAHVNSVGGSSGAEVLYVRQLTIESGARLDLGGKTLYYATSTPVNPTPRVIDSVGGGRLLQLGGGGVVRGDLNSDCKVDIADMPLFIQVLLGLDTTPSRVTAADMNASGQADGGDIQTFVGAILRP